MAFEYIPILADLGVTPPVIVMVALLGIHGCQILCDGDTYPPIDRDDLILLDVLVEDFQVEADELLRPVFDAIWQAAGWRRCFNYNEKGEWVERSC